MDPISKTNKALRHSCVCCSKQQWILKIIVANGSMTRSRSQQRWKDIFIYKTEEARRAGSPLSTFCMLMWQQADKELDDPDSSQSSDANFIAPAGYKDHHLGTFAFACFGCDGLMGEESRGDSRQCRKYHVSLKLSPDVFEYI
jgi:hypothetical protein